MSKTSTKSHLYRNPLPLVSSSDHYGPAPHLYPHNPISWMVFGWWYLSTQCKSVPHEVTKVAYHDGQFKVYDDVDIARLWLLGFFGKGSLSRSDPSWKIRTIRRLGLQDPEGIAGFSSEDVTNQRREERRRFKHERARVHELELKNRQRGLSSDEQTELEQLQEKLKEWRKQATVAVEHPEAPLTLRAEDEALVDHGSGTLAKNIEYLQLQPVEFFFLYFALGVAKLEPEQSLQQVLQLLVPEPSSSSRFFIEYAVYHHYRSLGWCVRLGIKFGSDMLLYKRGPPFSHAEYAVSIMDANCVDWTSISSLARVVGGVKKTLVLVYVDVPSPEQFHRLWSSIETPKDVLCLLQCYKITEVLYRRWVPSRTRD